MFRCKMFVAHMSDCEIDGNPAKNVSLYGVYESLPDVEGNSCEENAIFGKWTPCANFNMSIVNPNVIEQLEIGKQFYVDFEEVSK